MSSTVVGVIASTVLAIVDRMSATVNLATSWLSEAGVYITSRSRRPTPQSWKNRQQTEHPLKSKTLHRWCDATLTTKGIKVVSIIWRKIWLKKTPDGQTNRPNHLLHTQTHWSHTRSSNCSILRKNQTTKREIMEKLLKISTSWCPKTRWATKQPQHTRQWVIIWRQTVSGEALYA